MRAAKGSDGGTVRHRARRWVRLVCGAAAVLAVIPAAAAATPQAATITSVSVLRSTWMKMTVAVSYADPASTDTLRLDVQWRRLNGRVLRFSGATARMAPGSGQIQLQTTYHGVVPPPTPMVMHLAVAAPNGTVLLERDCEMALVTAQGKEAWAGDLVTRNANTLSWRVRSCK
ncbi:MAG TPA: hypothetical protein VL157_04335 [Gemmatimonadaceae bacterium]|jgi:hypothetical protein|nr:hypothetical protein [Gemmatimonadaceae bacterium]